MFSVPSERFKYNEKSLALGPLEWASGLVTGLVPARSWDRSLSRAVGPQEEVRQIGKDKEMGSSPRRGDPGQTEFPGHQGNSKRCSEDARCRGIRKGGELK